MRLVRALKHVRLRNYAQIGFKVSMIVWMTILALYTPAISSAVLGATVLLLTGATILGSIVAIVGIVMTCQPGAVGRKGLGVELAGLYSMLIGPLLYCITQIIIASTTAGGWYLRGAFVAALFVIVMAVLARAAIVGHRWRLLRKR